MDNVVVAGAAGFIGKNLSRYLRELGMHIIALDRVAIDLPDVESKSLDLTNREQVLHLLRGIHPRWVFNLTGQINHTVAWSEQRDLMNQHWLSMLNLLEAFDNNRPESFINIGSSDEYGAQPSPQKEINRESPIAPYSAAKVAATHYLQMWYRQTGFPAVIARFFLVYGPEQDNRRLIPWACKTLLRGEIMPASAGEQSRDFLYVQDAVEGLVALAQAPNTHGEVFNLASGNPITVRQVLETIQTTVGRGQIDFGARPMREGEPDSLYADISKIHQFTGWQPLISLKTGIQKTVEFYAK